MRIDLMRRLWAWGRGGRSGGLKSRKDIMSLAQSTAGTAHERRERPGGLSLLSLTLVERLLAVITAYPSEAAEGADLRAPRNHHRLAPQLWGGFAQEPAQCPNIGSTVI